MLSRRELIGLGAAAGLASGCAPLAARLRHKAPLDAFALPAGPTEPAVRLFGRAGFGHRPGDLQAYAADGHEKTVERLLHADAPEDPTLIAQISRLEAFRMNADEMEDLHREEVVRQLQQGAFLRSVYGANPLKERMVDFWTNHFNIYGPKETCAWRKGSDEDHVIRENALGSFPKMLEMSARSPAMLAYLDNERNVSGHANENYARELMELHTLGVDGGYTQRDIQEVARCFTGWMVEERFLRRKGTFRFDPDRHDNGRKMVLGHVIPAGGGEADAQTVLAIVSRHPSTAKFLAKKLSLYFLGERHPRVEGEVAEAYGKTGGDIRAMLRPILFSPALLEGSPILKRPLDLVASALRALDASTDGSRPIQEHLNAMGQAACQWPMPDGYPVKPTAWSGSMLPRWNFAFALAEGRIRGTTLERADLSKSVQVEALLGKKPDAELLQAVERDGLGVALASPEFQWR
ncbi:DUF1800 domain-containing protein [Fimbriimonas ginsengisoli]|uniref:Uncharacterized protein n=1 Tax=Fimbriimonas ginsengisoli Gsoil 348 TaxID=661478 RepID=A0A068NQ69_FIMGI|nr:DUF1800 domain-containing protein [Fimbriimonas ginsengisoli]AIE84905.1 hypothetical protein OP10G_1537 [Fimbriimonas ginsengisoli Gsoil 348]